jgi:hypothetical protein
MEKILDKDNRRRRFFLSCSAANAGSLEIYSLPYTNVEIQTSGATLSTPTISYGLNGGSIQATVDFGNVEGTFGGTQACSGSVSFVANRYVVYNSDVGGPPPTLYLQFGMGNSTETDSVSTNREATAGGSVAIVTNGPAVTANCPSDVSSYSLNEKGGVYTHSGSPGGTSSTTSIAWQPIWTQTASNTWTSSTCSVQSPLCTAGISLGLGGTIQAISNTTFAIPFNISLSPAN